MDKARPTLKRLTQLGEDDWKVALEKCRRLINHRVQGRTKFGCHSEQHLGMSPFDYYVTEALDKLYSGTWEWKEKYSLSEQLCRIVGSLISENVRKYKLEQEKDPKTAKIQIPFDDIAYYFGVDFDECAESKEREEIHENQLTTIMEAVDGNDEMETLLSHIMDGKSNDDICNKTGWERRKLYKVADRMKTRVKDYVTTNSKKIIK